MLTIVSFPFQAVAAVMQSWTGVFRAMQIARTSLAARAEADSGEDPSRHAVPDTLVRLPVDGGKQEPSVADAEEA